MVRGSNEGLHIRQPSQKTVGIIKKGKKFTKSTSDLFKPGVTYGYPLLKVHKLTLDQIKSKTLPPSRFVSDLSRSLSVRSDKYLVWSWLKNLSVDFATDLVKDSSEALLKLQDFSNGRTCNEMGSFNFDVVSLYDSLSPD